MKKNGSAPIRAVLYDFDGTLADTTELILQCYRHTMECHLGEVPAEEQWLAGFGTPLEEQLARFARTQVELTAMLETYTGFQRLHYSAVLRPFPGAVETINMLAQRGVELAIVTSRHRESTLRGIDLCGLTDHIPTIVTPEDVTHAKPHPEPVLYAIDQLGIEPEEAVFIGDSPHDLVAGRLAGTRTAAALWGPFPRVRLEAEEPDFLLEQHPDVFSILDS